MHIIFLFTSEIFANTNVDHHKIGHFALSYSLLHAPLHEYTNYYY